jgi:hypothetical protein
MTYHEPVAYTLLSVGNISTFVSLMEQEFQILRKPDFNTRDETSFRCSVGWLAASGETGSEPRVLFWALSWAVTVQYRVNLRFDFYPTFEHSLSKFHDKFLQLSVSLLNMESKIYWEYQFIWSRDSSVGIATDCGPDNPFSVFGCSP